MATRRNIDFKRLLDLATLDKPLVEKVVEKVASKWRGQSVKLFSTEGTSGGDHWEPLNPKYKEWKSKKYPGKKILNLTGDMRQSFLNKSHPDYIQKHDWKRNSSTWSIFLGSKNEKALEHAHLKARQRGQFDIPYRNPGARTDTQIKELEIVMIKALKAQVLRIAKAIAGGA